MRVKAPRIRWLSNLRRTMNPKQYGRSDWCRTCSRMLVLSSARCVLPQRRRTVIIEHSNWPSISSRRCVSPMLCPTCDIEMHCGTLRIKTRTFLFRWLSGRKTKRLYFKTANGPETCVIDNLEHANGCHCDNCGFVALPQ